MEPCIILYDSIVELTNGAWLHTLLVYCRRITVLASCSTTVMPSIPLPLKVTVAALHQGAPGQMTWPDWKKGRLFWGTKCIPWRGFLKIFWPQNDLVLLLLWRLHLMTCLTTLVTWKWPGCLDVLTPPLETYPVNGEVQVKSFQTPERFVEL